MKILIASIAFAITTLGGSAAYAASTGGFAALSLAEAVGLRSPTVSFAHKLTLKKFRAGNTTFVSSNAPFTFSAAAIDCGASNVDITHYRCRLTFGSSTIEIDGAAAQQLFATLIEAGVPGDGAAGTIHEAVTALSCTVDVGQVKARAGGGATCSFTPN
ncbi:MAG TPA: hypothetical protein VGC36_08725 [Rhizomicrobium sp.]